MDLPYSQHHFARRKQRSAGNLEHLSLAPLTTRLPLQDPPVFDVSDYPPPATSYLQGRSAPVTPRLLSTSPPPLGRADPSRTHARTMSGTKTGRKKGPRISAAAGNGNGIDGSTGSAGRVPLPKSRSTTHLLGSRRHLLRHGQRRPSTYDEEDEEEGGNGDATDEWLFRAGALVTSETREFKGQSWLTARASSTSLAGLQGLTEADGGDNTASERERERRQRTAGKTASSSVYGSRRGSAEQLQHLLHQQQLLAANGFSSRASSLMGSRRHSGTGSRVRSRVGSQMQLHMPKESRGSGGGINGNDCVDEDDADGDDAGYDLGEEGEPDFVHLDKKLEALQLHGALRQAEEDEDQIRRLVKREKNSGIMGGWFGSLFGWPLFSVQGGDDEDENDDDGNDDNEESGVEQGITDEEEEVDGEEGDNAERSDEARAQRQARRNRRAQRRARAYFDGIANSTEERVPPPPEADEGTWKDAAWLLSVASKVLF